jgi:putative DNA primase/helicase
MTPKPTALSVKPDSIPVELKSIDDAWVLWRYEWVEGRWTKVPYQIDGKRKAKSDDPSTWGSFDSAIKCYPEGSGGIGFMLSKEQGIIGVDLDHCIDEITKPWALAIVFALNSYTEISPSGTGLRILLKGALPPNHRKKDNIEMYDSGRYLTMTGHHRAGLPLTIENRAEEILALHQRVFTKPEIAPRCRNLSTVNLSDAELLEKAFSAKNGAKVKALYSGDIGGYQSQSSADMALCNHLAFYSADSNQIDRLFRSSGLYREKWDERHYADGRTYGEGTVEESLDLRGR